MPGLTQNPIEPGERFIYKIHFRDAGIYWYHPHVREDIQQELGLYGNILVDSEDPEYFNPVTMGWYYTYNSPHKAGYGGRQAEDHRGAIPCSTAPSGSMSAMPTA